MNRGKNLTAQKSGRRAGAVLHILKTCVTQSDFGEWEIPSRQKRRRELISSFKIVLKIVKLPEINRCAHFNLHVNLVHGKQRKSSQVNHSCT